MFEALIYDRRDIDSDHPESTLGEFPTVTDAANAIAVYFKARHVLGHDTADQIYKVEIIPASR